MRTTTLGSLGEVSRLTLGGGGIGQIWGENSREEAQATLTAAIDGGITVLDAAPMYRNCQAFIGEVFGGKLPAEIFAKTFSNYRTLQARRSAPKSSPTPTTTATATRSRPHQQPTHTRPTPTRSPAPHPTPSSQPSESPSPTPSRSLLPTPP